MSSLNHVALYGMYPRIDRCFIEMLSVCEHTCEFQCLIPRRVCVYLYAVFMFVIALSDLSAAQAFSAHVSTEAEASHSCC